LKKGNFSPDNSYKTHQERISRKGREGKNTLSMQSISGSTTNFVGIVFIENKINLINPQSTVASRQFISQIIHLNY